MVMAVLSQGPEAAMHEVVLQEVTSWNEVSNNAKHLDFRILVELTVLLQLIFEKLYTA